MAAPDIPAPGPSSKNLRPARSVFELWAKREGYDVAPAVCPAPNRIFADRNTQAVFDAWIAGISAAADTLLRDKLEAIQCAK